MRFLKGKEPTCTYLFTWFNFATID